MSLENIKIKSCSEEKANEIILLAKILGYERLYNNFTLVNGWVCLDSDDDELNVLCVAEYQADNSLDKYKEITIEQLRDMVVLKRNEPDDATHEHKYDGGKYLNLYGVRYWHSGESWVESRGGIVEGLLKPIKEKQAHETEYLLQGKNGEHLLESIEQLRIDSNFEQLVQKGIDEENSGKLIPHNEVMEKIKTKIEMCEGGSSTVDNVNHPSHYCSHPSGIECIEITRHHDFAIGNAIKYLWRAGLKESDNEIQDLKKAVFYIQDKIKQLESKNVDDKTIDWIDEYNK